MAARDWRADAGRMTDDGKTLGGTSATEKDFSDYGTHGSGSCTGGVYHISDCDIWDDRLSIHFGE